MSSDTERTEYSPVDVERNAYITATRSLMFELELFEYRSIDSVHFFIIQISFFINYKKIIFCKKYPDY